MGLGVLHGYGTCWHGCGCVGARAVGLGCMRVCVTRLWDLLHVCECVTGLWELFAWVWVCDGL